MSLQGQSRVQISSGSQCRDQVCPMHFLDSKLTAPYAPLFCFIVQPTCLSHSLSSLITPVPCNASQPSHPAMISTKHFAFENYCSK